MRILGKRGIRHYALRECRLYFFLYVDYGNDWIVDQLGIRLLLLRKFSMVHREENEGRQKNKAGMRK